jgi:hypothetical protein
VDKNASEETLFGFVKMDSRHRSSADRDASGDNCANKSQQRCPQIPARATTRGTRNDGGRKNKVR